MKLSAAFLSFVAVASLVSLALGFFPGGLTSSKATAAMLIGAAVAMIAYRQTDPSASRLSAGVFASSASHPISILMWTIFGLASLRVFLWLIFPIDDEWCIQSPNNLGDLAMHIQFIEYLASGIRFWPESPIYYEGTFRYPFGIDLFNALQVAIGLPLFEVLKWTALISSAITAYLLWRWGGAFSVAAFLFAGGLAGFAVFQTLQIKDYQMGVAWKNLFLALFVTQRGLLWAIPAGLILLINWRDKLLGIAEGKSRGAKARKRGSILGWLSTSFLNLSQPNREEGKLLNRSSALLPFWVQLLLYASMPLFHIHTFLALSLVLVIVWISCLLTRRLACRSLSHQMNATLQISTVFFFFLGCSALIPASALLYFVTGKFTASSFLAWNPGWMSTGNQLQFWLTNFGVSLPLAIVTCIIIGLRTLISPFLPISSSPRLSAAFWHIPFAISAAFLFLLAVTFRFAPWEWDNIKLLLWSWLIIAPLIWEVVILPLKAPFRYVICFGLFFSGAISLLGGLGSSHSYFLISRKELAQAYEETKNIHPEARFAIEPTYNHPLILLGRKVVMGYPGHVWSHGYDYQGVKPIFDQAIQKADSSDITWKRFNADYLFLKDTKLKIHSSDSDSYQLIRNKIPLN